MVAGLAAGLALPARRCLHRIARGRLPRRAWWPAWVRIGKARASYQGHVRNPFSGDFMGLAAADETSRMGSVTRGRCDRQGPAASTSCGRRPGLRYLPLGVMQRSGRWMVSSTSVRKLTRVEGVLDVRLLNGQSDVYATA
jgi:hypothetical protein